MQKWASGQRPQVDVRFTQASVVATKVIDFPAPGGRNKKSLASKKFIGDFALH
jgi:hypothetical protein